MTRRRSLQAVLQTEGQKNRYEESDVQHRIYVRPLGNTGVHIVKSRPDGAEYQVAGPQRTFAPGQSVPTGRYTGRQGETILIEPPPGRRGQAAPTGDSSVTPAQPDIQGWQTHFALGTAAGYHVDTFHHFGLIAGTEDPYPAPPNAFLYIVDGLDRNGVPDVTAWSLFSFEPFNATLYKMVVINKETYSGNTDPGADPPIPPACKIAFKDENGFFLGAMWHYFWVA